MIDSDSVQMYSQYGLCYISSQSIYATFHLTEEARSPETSLEIYNLLTHASGKINKKVKEMTKASQANDSFYPPRSHTGISHAVIFGVNLDLWKQMCKELSKPLPEAFDKNAIKDINRILKTSPPYKNSGGDFYFHIKSDSLENCKELFDNITEILGPFTKSIDWTEGNSQRDGRVYGRRLLHGLIHVVDPINLSSRIIIGDEDPDHEGACFGLTQKFVHNWNQIQEMSQCEIEDMIGRDSDGNIIPNLDRRSHLRCVRAKNAEGLNYSIFTQGQPFGDANSGNSREKGVFVSAFAKSITAFNQVLDGMLGEGFDDTEEVLDKHLRYSSSVEGNIWYIPSAEELKMGPHTLQNVEINPFFKERSKNGLMYYNSKDFLHEIWKQRVKDDFPLSDRVIELLGKTFTRWHNNWYEPPVFPSLPTLEEFLSDAKNGFSVKEKNTFLSSSVAERKGLSIKFTLKDLFSTEYCKDMDLFRIDPKELIAGVLPPFTLGTGVAVMRYLRKDELLNGYLLGLDETSMAGHVVPDYETILEKGLGCLMDETREKLANAAAEETKREFYQSVLYSLEGVQGYFRNYAELARTIRSKLPKTQEEERKNLEQIAERMDKLSVQTPESFLDALQMIFSIHCCMHLIGELVSIGRIDQLLAPFYERDNLSQEDAQEAIDCFWIKMDEKVLMNRHYYQVKRTYGTCAIPYTGGPVPIGNKLSQWVMQVTVGGYQATDDLMPKDACNAVTLMALRAARRLPLNSPCLSLRMNKYTSNEVLNESTIAILSGGAAPFFYNDDFLVEGVLKSGTNVKMKDARNYCSDGCWETIIPGKTELGLSYIIVTNAVELALNQGATYVNAGTSYIRGSQISFLSRPAEDIEKFEDFLKIFYEHYKWLNVSFFNGIFSRYGNLWKFCPSPLLSSLIEGCLESGRDLTNGGARYHMLAPQIFGITCVIDSLWAIKKLVFDPATSVTDLPELRECLLCDWGYDMIEPFESSLGGPERSALNAQRFKHLREAALSLPKFGSGNKEVDDFGGQIAGKLKEITENILKHPEKEVSADMKKKLDSLVQKYSISDQPGQEARPFSFHLTPAYGTFEDYLGVGMQNGASADGRRKGTSLSSNFSPMISPMDLKADSKPRNISRALKGWNRDSFKEALKIVAPVDINIPENFPPEELEKVLREFSLGKLGSNMLTITCADHETLEKAQKYPERYDLIRVRMGGWSEFFISLYKDLQKQQLRRPMFLAD